MADFRDDSLQIVLVDIYFSISQLDLSYKRFWNVQDCCLLVMENFGNVVGQHLYCDSLHYPLKLFLFGFSAVFLTCLDLSEKLLEIFKLGFSYHGLGLLLRLLKLLSSQKQLIRHEGFLLEVKPEVFLIQIQLLQGFLLILIFLLQLTQPLGLCRPHSGNPIFQLFTHGLFFLLLSLLQFLIPLLLHKIPCFTDNIGDLTVWQLPHNTQVPDCPKVLNKLAQIFPSGEGELYVMFVLRVLLVDVFNILGFTRVLGLEDLHYSVFKLVGVFLDVLLGIGGELPESFLMVR